MRLSFLGVLLSCVTLLGVLTAKPEVSENHTIIPMASHVSDCSLEHAPSARLTDSFAEEALVTKSKSSVCMKKMLRGFAWTSFCAGVLVFGYYFSKINAESAVPRTCPNGTFSGTFCVLSLQDEIMSTNTTDLLYI